MERKYNLHLSKEEQKAIASLERLAKKWPETLELFGWSGSCYVTKSLGDGRRGLVTSISIVCDGGDPSDDEVEQQCNITYAK